MIVVIIIIIIMTVKCYIMVSVSMPFLNCFQCSGISTYYLSVGHQMSELWLLCCESELGHPVVSVSGLITVQHWLALFFRQRCGRLARTEFDYIARD